MKIHAMILAMTCAVGLGGCTHLTNPYELHAESTLYAACGSEGQETVLGEVCSTSTALQKKYIEAAGQHERARNLAGTGLLAGAAYAGLMGVSESIGPANAEDQIAAIASGSALGLGWTSLFTSPRRQDVYIAGVEAISCVQRRAAPFDIPEDDFHDFRVALKGDDHTPTFAALIAVVKAGGNHADLVDAAEKTLADAELLYAQLNGTAAADMRFSLIKIDTAVMREIRKSQPDLQAIRTVSDSLPQIASQLGGKLDVGQGDPQREGLTKTDKEKRAEEFSEKLRSQKLTLDKIIAAVKAGIEAAGKMTDCGLDAATLKMEAIPGELTFTAGTAEEKVVTITRGEAPFTAYFPSSPTGLTTRHLSPFDRNFTIVATADVKAGSALLLAVDKSGIPIQVHVTISAKQEDGGDDDD